MSIEIVIARLLHVVLGVFWAGTMIFTALFLVPAMAEAGPDAAKVMAGIQRRRFMDVMPVVALVTIVSGLWLFWRISGGFDPAWSRSRMGMAYGIGAVLALVAFGIGVGIMRPTMMRIGSIVGQAAQATDSAQRDTLMAPVPALRRRSASAGRAVALLLALATALMGIARYL
ncbi:MAG: DUF1772 domain-containing protein [Gemmatimonadota bacterium]|nr:DUF1772 domain-containing protein [Gemmatimonadota bacterium]